VSATAVDFVITNIEAANELEAELVDGFASLQIAVKHATRACIASHRIASHRCATGKSSHTHSHTHTSASAADVAHDAPPSHDTSTLDVFPAVIVPTSL
jgi:hypothetical protein